MRTGAPAAGGSGKLEKQWLACVLCLTGKAENRDQENSGRLCLKCRRAGNSGEESLWDHTVNFSAASG